MSSLGSLDTLNNVFESLEVDLFKSVVLGLEFLGLLLIHLDDGFVVLKTVFQILLAHFVEIANAEIVPHTFKCFQVVFLLFAVSQLASNKIGTFLEGVGNNLHFGVVAEAHSPFDVAVVFSADSEVRAVGVGESGLKFGQFSLLHLDKGQVEVFNIGATQLVDKFIVIFQVKLNIDVAGSAVTTENSNEGLNTLNEGFVVF